MPRQKRVDEAGVCYHAINRGNARQEIFHKPEDYDAFIRVLSHERTKVPGVINWETSLHCLGREQRCPYGAKSRTTG